MAYSDFTMATIRQRLGITVSEGNDLFADVPEVDRVEYSIQSPRRVFGILSHIALGVTQ